VLSRCEHHKPSIFSRRVSSPGDRRCAVNQGCLTRAAFFPPDNLSLFLNDISQDWTCRTSRPKFASRPEREGNEMWAGDRNCKDCSSPLQSSGIALDDNGELFVMCDACCARHGVTQLPRLPGTPIRFQVGALIRKPKSDSTIGNAPSKPG
jgi:hypothetical protein